MFGSLFRSAVVVGTIYAISPVKLDATPYPPASGVPVSGKAASAGQGSKTGVDLSVQAAALAPQLLSHATGSAQGQVKTDQIGDLITLGKDVCLANPGLCLEAAKALHDSKIAQDNKPTQDNKPVQTKAAPAPAKTQAAPSAPMPEASESSKSKQPDALAALIEKTVQPPSPALAKSVR
mgnify:FL=1